MNGDALRRWAPRIGSLLAITATAYVVASLWQQREALGDWSPGPGTGAMVGLAALLYGASNQFLAVNWRALLRLFDPTIDLEPRAARSIYARSQIAKYLPGNVLHLASRHLLLRERGYGHGVLLITAVHEMGGLLAAAALIGLLAWALLGIALPSLGAGAIALATAIVAAYLFGHRLLERLGVGVRDEGSATGVPERPAAPPNAARTLAMVLLGYCGFFLVAGASLAVVAWGIGGAMDLPGLATTLAVFAIGWTAGFLTPGAPSGLGVREAVIVSLLDGLFPPAQGLLIALVFRGVTVSGDLGFLLYSTVRDRSD